MLLAPVYLRLVLLHHLRRKLRVLRSGRQPLLSCMLRPRIMQTNITCTTGLKIMSASRRPFARGQVRSAPTRPTQSINMHNRSTHRNNSFDRTRHQLLQSPSLIIVCRSLKRRTRSQSSLQQRLVLIVILAAAAPAPARCNIPSPLTRFKKYALGSSHPSLAGTN